MYGIIREKYFYKLQMIVCNDGIEEQWDIENIVIE